MIRNHEDVRKKGWSEWRSGPPGWALIVRGSPDDGTPMTIDGLRKAAKRPVKRWKFFGLSVATFRSLWAQGIATRFGIPHEYYAVCRARDLRRAGYEVRMIDHRTPGHASIVFPGEPSDEDLARIVSMFGASRRNRMSATRRGGER